MNNHIATRKVTKGRIERYSNEVKQTVHDPIYCNLTVKERINERIKDRQDLRLSYINKGKDTSEIEVEISMLRRSLVNI